MSLQVYLYVKGRGIPLLILANASDPYLSFRNVDQLELSAGTGSLAAI
jgi:hypothetical protein